MHPRVRALVLASAALVALVPSGGAAAFAASSGPALPHAAVSQSLTWTVVPSANRKPIRGRHDNELYGISCVSASSCTAVGFSVYHASPKTLIETWNGTAWSLVPSPNTSADNILSGVSCVSVTACTAVGTAYSRRHTYKTLIESWNGTAWSVMPSPNPARGTGVDRLFGVSCVSASACTAVGYDAAKSGGPLKPLVVTWNGTTWSRVHVPRPGISGALNSVSCAGTAFCTAIGGYSVSRRVTKNLVETWNGTSWSVVPAPGDGLFSVSCIAATACTAVGGVASTLAESWNGTSWSIVPSPNPSNATGRSELTGVSCVAADSCTAIGNYIDSGTQPTLIEAWDGTSWSIVPSPTVPPKTTYQLNGVSCPSPTMCMAAGWRFPFEPFDYRTLTELGTSSG
jgi:hypothetical protein